MTVDENQLNKIPPIDRRILQILSLYREQITQQDLALLLNYLDLNDEKDRKFTQKWISAFRARYIERGILKDTYEPWGKGFKINDPKTAEVLTRETVDEKWFEPTIYVIQRYFGIEEFSRFLSVGEKYKSRLLRDYRLSIYLDRRDRIESLYAEIEHMNLGRRAQNIIFHVFSNPFQEEFLAKFDHLFQINAIVRCFIGYFSNFMPTGELWEFVDNHGLEKAPVIRGIRAEDLIFRGELDRAEELIGGIQDLMQITSRGTIAFLRRDYSAAVKFYEASIKLWRDLAGRKQGYSGFWQMFFYGLALYKTDEPKFHKFVDKFTAYSKKHRPENSVEKSLAAVSAYLKNDPAALDDYFHDTVSDSFFDVFLRVITAAVLPGAKQVDFAREFCSASADLGFQFAELEALNLLLQKGVGNEEQSIRFAKLREKTGIKPVGNLIPELEDWERALNSLLLVAESVKTKSESKTANNETRLAWLLDLKDYEIQPVEQKFTNKSWTKGRNVALKRLYEGKYDKATEHDTRVIRGALRQENYYSGYGSPHAYSFDWDDALIELIGHPLLFSIANREKPLELVGSEPTLRIRETETGLKLSFDIEIFGAGVVVQKETELRFKVLNISEHHVEIAETLRNGMTIPMEGRETLLKAIRPLSKRISIQSDLEEHFEDLPLVEPDKRIHALLTQSGDGFHLEFFVKPFGSVPPYFKPGKGGESVIADFDGVRTRIKRDLAFERNLLDEVESACPFLAAFESRNYEWFLATTEECLTAMTEMETPRIDGKLVIEWPKGQKLQLIGRITSGNISISVKSKNEWFEVDGEAAVSEELVLSIRELRGLLKQTTGNFIELSDGQFVAITEKLRRHLQAINAVTDEKNRIHKLRSGILEDLSQEIENFKSDKAWKDHLRRIAESGNYVPILPATFEAELRPYQIEGFMWLSRLAYLGVGACLADDMGLGKTLQALAILVERAELGPALVVAPVSVCRNWLKEAVRFSPTLNFQIFGEGNREEVVKKLGKYDVLVTSYSLLQNEEALMTEREFATVVLDEAQAIKNRNTKRSKTVMKLKAGFRLVTTGTPIENHLGELWNLFNFLNPGMLGSAEFFNQRFAIPIERDKDQRARKTLQRLVKPYILRRRKNQVLDDLPDKTEIILSVEMSDAERAFYESLRRNALDAIENADGNVTNKRFRILAELTRLRLASCHPKLVDPEIPIESSKLELFGETIEELLENKHKALVFSQFVKHLAIIEEYLKNKGISYQYLDGSTPPKKRQQRIDEFQRGIGDVFLISLKAGGTGLNLTAADYVIHLDPWWNPAVEDQATDRVHRIGQQRPVTVYRLVTENSVEEKILKLHETKRDLADSLLDGTDSSGKLTAADLLDLIAAS